MALLTYDWHRPDVDSLVRLALAGQEQDRLAAIQQIEQQRLQQKQQSDLALQLRQERRMLDAEKFKEGLDTARELRAGTVDAAKADYYRRKDTLAKGGLSPVFLPSDPAGDLPSDPAAAAAPDVEQSPSVDLLHATDTPSLSSQLDLNNPAPFSFAAGDQPANAEPFSAQLSNEVAADPLSPAALLRTADPIVSSTGQAASAEPPPIPAGFQPTDMAGILRQTASQPWPGQAAPAAEGDISAEPDLMGGARPGGPVGGSPASALAAASKQLDPSARARVNAIATLEAAGQAKPGSSSIVFQRELANADRIRQAAEKPTQQKIEYLPDGTIRSGTTLYRYNDKGELVKIGTSKAEPQSLSEATKGLDYVADHGTYRDPETGSESFYYQSGGKINTRPFNPNLHPARSVPGSDGGIYFVDAQGDPVKPLPEGVTLGKFQKPTIHSVPGGGIISVDRAGTPTLIVPPGVPMTNDDKKAYSDAVQSVQEARAEVDDETALLRDKPRGATAWFGGSQSKVDAAKKKVDDASKKAAAFFDKFPQLKMTIPGGATLPQAPGSPAAPSAPAARKFSTPIEVKGAVASGSLSKDEAAKILREQFGFQ